MKNLLIYTGPQKKFSQEDEVLARIQIDNSLDLGWEKENIILATDFPFEYNGIKSLIIPGGVYYEFDKNANKVPAILYLMQHAILVKDDIYWCHDLDAYENNAINEQELGLNAFDLGLTHYFYKPEWQFGSLFFKEAARDIFELLDHTIGTRPHLSRNNEKTLTWLIKHNAIDPKRYKKLNVTYNFTKRYIPTVYREATKPLKVLHFRPSDTKENDPLMTSDSALNMFMYGKNRLKVPLVSDRLVKVFHQHGIK